MDSEDESAVGVDGVRALFSSDADNVSLPVATDRATGPGISAAGSDGSGDGSGDDGDSSSGSSGGSGGSDSNGRESHRNGSRPQHWWSPFIALAVILVLVAGGAGIGVIIAQKMHHRAVASTLAGLNVESVPATPSAQKTTHDVILRVKGHGEARVNYVTFVGTKSVTTNPTLVSLPWTHHIKVSKKAYASSSFTITGHNYTSTKKITVSIEVDGKIVSTASRTGRYALVTATRTL